MLTASPYSIHVRNTGLGEPAASACFEGLPRPGGSTWCGPPILVASRWRS